MLLSPDILRPAIAVSVFIALYLLIVGVYRVLAAGRLRILLRLENVKRLRRVEGHEDAPLEAPFADRVLRPMFDKISGGISALAPNQVLASTDQRLTLAGQPWGMKAGQFLTLQVSLIVLLGALTLLISLAVGVGALRTMGVALLAALFGFLVPQLMISSRVSARQHEVEKALPDALDLLVVSVEAGLALDMAMQKVTEKMHGVLAREFARTLHEIKLGKVRRQALRDMADRLGVRSLSSFVSALIQADRLGVSMGNVLRIQSENMRRERRQRAEEQAMKAPVKMLFPMIFFIFPALFIVVLGPAIIQLSTIFSNTF